MTTATLEAPATTRFAATLTRAELLHGLGAVVAVTPSRATLPVLKAVRLDATPKGITMTATDLDTWATLRVSGEGEGSVLVEAKQLLDLARLLPDGPVRLEMADDGLAVRAGRSRTVLETIRLDEWPDPPGRDDADTATIRAAALHDLAGRVAFAVSTAESRPILNGVLLEIRANTVGMVATNGHKLGNATAVTSSRGGDRDLIVPPKALDLAARIIPEGDLTLSWSANYLTITGDGGEVRARLIEGPYPNWRQVMPNDAAGWLTVDRMALIAAVRRALIVASDQTHGIRFEVGADGVTVLADGRGKAHEQLDGRYDGEPITIRFNGHYIIEILSRVTTNAVRIGLTAPERAALVEPHEPGPDEPDVRYLVMPLRPLD